MDYTLRTDQFKMLLLDKDEFQRSSQIRNKIKRIYNKSKWSKKWKANSHMSSPQAQSMLVAKNKEKIYFIQKLFNYNLNPIKINKIIFKRNSPNIQLIIYSIIKPIREFYFVKYPNLIIKIQLILQYSEIEFLKVLIDLNLRKIKWFNRKGINLQK